MKLRNKKTGEIAKIVGYVNINDRMFFRFEDDKDTYKKEYNSLAELNEEWEDFEEDRIYWFIDVDGEIKSKELGWFNQAQDNIGNRFKTKEEAEKAVEKLKAWKRLKDKGFRFTYWTFGHVEFVFDNCLDDCYEDLKLLFGDEE